MFEYLIATDQMNIKRNISHWLKVFIIDPILKIRTADAVSYLVAFDRKKAAAAYYEFLNITKELDDVLLQIDKKKLVKDIAMYIDLQTPFAYYRSSGIPTYQVNKQMLEAVPFKWKANKRYANDLVYEAKKSVILNNKEVWSCSAPSEKQLNTIKSVLRKKKQNLKIEIERLNKYQAALLIAYFLESQNYDQEEINALF